MEFTFEQIGTLGIFNFKGELTQPYEDNLKLTLMKAIHSIDRAILNFSKVNIIDHKCFQLLRQAYYTSVRLKKPLILIDLDRGYLERLANQTDEDDKGFSSVGGNEYDGVSKEALHS